MEKNIIKLPLGMFAFNVLFGALAVASFPVLIWALPVMLGAAFVYAVFAAFFATGYTAYHQGMSILMRLNFCLFAATVCALLADTLGLAPRAMFVLTGGYFAALITAYFIFFFRERGRNWSDFRDSLRSPTLAIEGVMVVRFIRVRGSSRAKKGKSPSLLAPLGAAAGVVAMTVVGAVFGAQGKALFQCAVEAAILVAPFAVLPFVMTYFVGVHEVRRVEKRQRTRFVFDNVEALQHERAKLGIARLVNPRLRQVVPPAQ
ncbi:hypothetical protein EOS_31380 [Caballeronia mineralivorans PML1(12)]|uniref:Uncharacterized protein n=1 Tax=Caballeronia mineralivorans PML1(12) TaxID=908627 RepID=A0A0J1CNH8_9BURK|nr:hypothetical protein [Caballeronia mineralivorans]KLU22300.1 hypothetical protein EOS_31380 [Caballeronia mineralivorans PML1(12)]